ncbi:site-specific integrase [uncultured Spirosoma sp.]|uniref:site-specific integrase n=1 Tax=uncultured Spirosoma sp. TaxID=278208 RepID=UPI00258D5B1B|nr:site-specific integrase [uncultured Spirosoma sp.]
MAQSTDHKEARATVRLVYRTSDVQKDGTCPFFICITKQRQRKYVATGLTLHPKYWDEGKQTIRRSYPDHLKRELQSRLKSLVDRYETTANALADADEQHDATTIASRAVEARKQTRRTTLLAYIDQIVQSLIKTGKTGNSIVYRDLRNQLAKFISDEYNAPDVPFAKVTVSFCNEWEETLRASGATDNTLSNRFRTLRAVLNRAIANEYAKPDTYPFARNVAEKNKFSIGKFDTSTQKRAISRDEVRKVESYTPVGVYSANQFPDVRNARAVANLKNRSEVDRLTLAKNVFLFSFYVGGINFVDLAKLRWENLVTDAEGNTRLTYVRQKTGGKFSLKLLATVIAIVEQYRVETFPDQNSYIFPILSASQHQTEKQINNRLHKMLGQVNKDLKMLGERAEISTPLTTYVARHSFATALRKAGTATAVISQAMGHKSEAVTAIYLDSFANEIVDDAFDSLL